MQKLHSKQQQWMPVLFLAPAVIMFVVYVIFPILQSIWLSFYEWDGIGDKTFIGLSNYVELFDDYQFWIALKNNLYWMVFFHAGTTDWTSHCAFFKPKSHGHPSC